MRTQLSGLSCYLRINNSYGISQWGKGVLKEMDNYY